MVATLGSALAVGFSPLGRRLAAELPLGAFVGFQVFRLPLELVMHEAAVEKVMPNVMSFSGYNFDIVSGVTAGIVALALARDQAPRGLVFAWNLLASVLLANIVTIACLATPLVHAFGAQELNIWVTQFPYCWMAVMVSSELLGHVLVAQKLVRGRAAVASAPRAAASG